MYDVKKGIYNQKLLGFSKTDFGFQSSMSISIETGCLGLIYEAIA